MWNPLSWVMEIAALMAIGLANGGVNLFYCSNFNHFTFLATQINTTHLMQPILNEP